MTNPLGRTPSSNVSFSPPQINSVEDTGLSALWLQDLALKVLYSRGYITGFKIAEEIALPFAGVTDQLLSVLKQEKLIDILQLRPTALGVVEKVDIVLWPVALPQFALANVHRVQPATWVEPSRITSESPRAPKVMGLPGSPLTVILACSR